MAGRRKIEKITETDFTVLLQTLKDTPKGRLFLDEFGRRARTEETATLLESIHRMNKAISPFVGDGQIRVKRLLYSSTNRLKKQKRVKMDPGKSCWTRKQREVLIN